MDADSLVLEVGKLPAATVTRLSIIRDGRRRTIDVTLSKYPVRGKKIVTTKPEAWRGMRVDYASTLLADSEQPLRGSLAFLDEAVVVSEVAEGTPAFRAGMKPGMLITQVDRVAVRTPKEFMAAVAGLGGRRAAPGHGRAGRGAKDSAAIAPGTRGAAFGWPR